MKNIALITTLLLTIACGDGDGDGRRETQGDPAQAEKLPWYLAKSAEGNHLCEIVWVVPEELPEEVDDTVVYLEFAFPKTADDLIFDRDVRVPRAVRPDGENRSGPWFLKPLVQAPRGVCIPDLHLGMRVDRIALLQVDAIVAQVLERKDYSFEGLGPGESGNLVCGAFELVVTGEAARCTVRVESFPEFAPVRAEYHMDVPPTVATHQWGVGALEVLDDSGERLELRGGAGGPEMALGIFVLPGPPDAEDRPISYPVTVKIGIPTRVRTEAVTFQFRNIPIAPYEKAK